MIFSDLSKNITLFNFANLNYSDWDETDRIIIRIFYNFKNVVDNFQNSVGSVKRQYFFNKNQISAVVDKVIF